MAKRRTFQEFKIAAIKKHGDRFEYPDGIYVDSNHKIKIKCIGCSNTFFQKPIIHLTGTGCPTCGWEQAKRHINKGFDSFMSRALLVHGGKYEYVGAYYINRRIKIPIYCIDCDTVFYQKPNCHLNGRGCASCSRHAVDGRKRGFVYKITCRVNGLVYVGITTTSLNIRLRRHFESCKYKASKSPLHDLMKCYSPSDFSIEPLEEGVASDLGVLEKKWINLLNSATPHGLNKATGGHGLLIKSNNNQNEKYQSLKNEILVLGNLVTKYSTLKQL